VKTIAGSIENPFYTTESVKEIDAGCLESGVGADVRDVSLVKMSRPRSMATAITHRSAAECPLHDNLGIGSNDYRLPVLKGGVDVDAALGDGSCTMVAPSDTDRGAISVLIAQNGEQLRSHLYRT
jgi:hypothetical protein